MTDGVHLGRWIDVAAADAVVEGKALGAQADGKPVALFRLGADIFALHDLCTHGRARLSDGFVEGDTVECPLHQGLVCIRTGVPKSAPITEPTKSYPARIALGRIEIFS
jgi:nitrite reductase/ring-hydroxylating ferredoxin subunit